MASHRLRGDSGGAALEAEIDERVCGLFGLTGEERKMVGER